MRYWARALLLKEGGSSRRLGVVGALVCRRLIRYPLASRPFQARRHNKKVSRLTFSRRSMNENILLFMSTSKKSEERQSALATRGREGETPFARSIARPSVRPSVPTADATCFLFRTAQRSGRWARDGRGQGRARAGPRKGGTRLAFLRPTSSDDVRAATNHVPRTDGWKMER